MPTSPTIQALSDPNSQPTTDGSEALPLADEAFDPTTAGFVKAVQNQEVPGVLFSLADLKRPEVAPIVANSRKLPQLGLGVYTNPEKGIAALFNPSVVSLKELQKVDAAGKLDRFLTPYSALGGTAKPSASPSSSTPPPTEITQPVVAQPPVAPLSRGAQTAHAKSRVGAAANAAKQKIPGGGSILNSLLS